MRPDGYYWIKIGKHFTPRPAQWWNGKWWLTGTATAIKDTKRIEVLAPCIFPSDGPA